MHPAAPPPGYCLEPGEELREYMRRSLFLARAGGRLDENAPIAAIGDYTSRALLEEGYRPHILVVDCMIERRHVECPPVPRGYRVVTVVNPRGCITWDAWRAVSEAWERGSTMIRVLGEDDLIAIPVILEAPGEALVAYGIPWSGRVVVEAEWARVPAEHIARGSTLRSIDSEYFTLTGYIHTSE